MLIRMVCRDCNLFHKMSKAIQDIKLLDG
jgi:hypothetical protein